MKLQNDVTAQMTEIQRLKGKTSAMSDQQRALSHTLTKPLITTFDIIELLEPTFLYQTSRTQVLCFCVCVHACGATSRAAKGSEARVHETGRAAKRGEEK